MAVNIWWHAPHDKLPLHPPPTIPLCARAVDTLRARLPNRPISDESVFASNRGRPFNVDALQNRLGPLREKRPERKDFSFHRLRHTCATYLARARVPERVAQSIHGHNSARMTRYFTATETDEMIDAVERLNDMGAPSETEKAASDQDTENPGGTYDQNDDPAAEDGD